MPPEPLPDPSTIAARLKAGERAAVSEALNLIDDRRADRQGAARALLDELEDRTREIGADGRGHRIGVTGAPGAGKSTLLDAITRELRARGKTVGILAVDPSSQRSGGALLGDRFRMRAGTRDSGVFVRSMAARERLGGLADATYASAMVLAAVFDRVFIETVGVGQSEADVAPLVDTLLFVAQPGAGDLLQFMKAGILELPDIFAVNKADVGPEAERTAGELEAGLGLAEAPAERGDWKTPVLPISARTGDGVHALIEAIDRHREASAGSGRLAERRERGRVRFGLDALRARYGSFGLDAIGGAKTVEQHIRSAAKRSVFAVVDDLGSRIEAALEGTP